MHAYQGIASTKLLGTDIMPMSKNGQNSTIYKIAYSDEDTTDTSNESSNTESSSTSECSSASDDCDPYKDQWIKISIKPLIKQSRDRNTRLILHSRELFWHLFCKAQKDHATHLPNHLDIAPLKIVENNSCLYVGGKKNLILEHRKQVEEIRKIFARNWEAQTAFVLLPIEYEGHIFFREAHDRPVLLHHHPVYTPSNDKLLFFHHTKPSISSVCSALGLACKRCITPQEFSPSFHSDSIQTLAISGFQIAPIKC
jgi:hypothetical protein